ncbi:MAG: SGNH/GDSL hydrolase family protein [Pyrinomonadaceae bacterium]
MRMKKRLISLTMLCVFLLTAAASAQQKKEQQRSPAVGDFYLKSGDRVVFYGDSITDQRLYTTFVETYVLTRFPTLDVSFIHSGWGGDRVTGGGGGKIEQRLERDVLAYRPTVVTIMLGMNDASYKAYDQGVFDTYSSGYENIVKRLKSSLPNVRMTLIQPSPYDDVTRPPTFEGGYNAVLVRYGEFLKQLAARERLDTADLNAYVVCSLTKGQRFRCGGGSKDCAGSRVHPGPGGHLPDGCGALLKACEARPLVFLWLRLTLPQRPLGALKTPRSRNFKSPTLSSPGRKSTVRCRCPLI